MTELVKNVFVYELRHYFDSQTSPDRLAMVPVIQKFASDLPAPDRELDPLETIVRVIRSHPDITERLPYIGIAASAGKNMKLAMSGKYVDAVRHLPRLVAGTGAYAPPVGTPAVVPSALDLTQFDDNGQPGVPVDWPAPLGMAQYGLVGADYVEFTTSFDGAVYTDHISFNDIYLGVSPQTPRMIADAINNQALYCQAHVVFYNNVPTLVIEPGGPCGRGTYVTIQKTAATANFDAYINLPILQKSAPSDEFPTSNRYLNSMSMTISMVLGTDGENIRAELTDLVQNFFCFVMEDRHFTFYGRSFFHADIPDETYQILIRDNEITPVGEQEVARQDDPMRKVYINKVDVPVHLLYYVDRNVQVGAYMGEL
jgi:hypothetical protein